MGYRGILQILLILAVISTICISIMKPKMHKPVMVYNSDFEVVRDDTTVKIEENNIPVMVQNTDIATDNSNDNMINQTPVFVNNNESSNIIQNTKNIDISNKNNTPVSNIGIKPNNTGTKSNNITHVKNEIKPVNTKFENRKPQVNQPEIDLNKIVSNNQKIQNTHPQNVQPQQTSQKSEHKQPVPQPQQTTKPPIRIDSYVTKEPVKITSNTNSQPIILTAQEEEIAWNKWRSNLNNQIMRDSKLPTMPNGIIFKYKFTVDKYGKVSNVQTWSSTSSYTPYAIQFIAPVIRSYQGHSILNFPAGSNRVTTEVTGAWKISSNEKFSNPSDYNDIEKIKK